ncbi:MAG: metalloregulator ArsR/SmtB family transcription factor [Candidatus Shapirobacteria bacterium]|nr:metalloregulator ArsR/SmtB family transcription factor [Candidatus Shapirobacteria bacterium]
MNMRLCSCGDSKCSCRSIEKSTLSALDQLSSLLKIVADNNRLKILFVLRLKDGCVCDLMEQVAMPQSLASHHLSDLKKVGLVVGERRGLRVYYSLTEKGRRVTGVIFKITELQ